eukprot:TRINITY_DN8692_c0_g7_i1.p1 TRINITY_DN8692_c0_g7~~TRINITY_DN8692_c0_g7_i1.p1  ORF type:complete len:789 (+),score=177.34 TRINITY_DN8692_c0_g7_i1:69-2435(+)
MSTPRLAPPGGHPRSLRCNPLAAPTVEPQRFRFLRSAGLSDIGARLESIAARFGASGGARGERAPFRLPALLAPRERDVEEQEGLAFYAARGGLLLPSLPAPDGARTRAATIVQAMMAAGLAIVTCTESLPALVKELLAMVTAQMAIDVANEDIAYADAQAVLEEARTVRRSSGDEFAVRSDSTEQVLPSPVPPDPEDAERGGWGWGWRPSWLREPRADSGAPCLVRVGKQQGSMFTERISVSPPARGAEPDRRGSTSPRRVRSEGSESDGAMGPQHTEPLDEQRAGYATYSSLRRDGLAQGATSPKGSLRSSPSRGKRKKQALPTLLSLQHSFRRPGQGQSDYSGSPRSAATSAPMLASPSAGSLMTTVVQHKLHASRIHASRRGETLDGQLQALLASFVSVLYQDEGPAEAERQGQAVAAKEQQRRQELPRHCKYWHLHPPTQIKEAADVPPELVAWQTFHTDDGAAGGTRKGADGGGDGGGGGAKAKARSIGPPPRGEGDCMRGTGAPRKRRAPGPALAPSADRSAKDAAGQLSALAPAPPSQGSARFRIPQPPQTAAGTGETASRRDPGDAASVASKPRTGKDTRSTAGDRHEDEDEDSEDNEEEEEGLGEEDEEDARNRRAMERQLLARQLLWGGGDDGEDVFDAVEVARKAQARRMGSTDIARLAQQRREEELRARLEGRPVGTAEGSGRGDERQDTVPPSATFLTAKESTWFSQGSQQPRYTPRLNAFRRDSLRPPPPQKPGDAASALRMAAQQREQYYDQALAAIMQGGQATPALSTPRY